MPRLCVVRPLHSHCLGIFPDCPRWGTNAQPSALAGGGRYDTLLETLGATQPVPASGFAAGIERLILAMKNKNIMLPSLYVPDVYLAQLGASAQKRSIGLMEQLRQAGFKVWGNLVKESLSAQLKVANKLAVRFTLILGQKELSDGTIIVRDMDSGLQEIVDIKKIEKELAKRIEKAWPYACSVSGRVWCLSANWRAAKLGAGSCHPSSRRWTVADRVTDRWR